MEFKGNKFHLTGVNVENVDKYYLLTFGSYKALLAYAKTKSRYNDIDFNKIITNMINSESYKASDYTARTLVKNGNWSHHLAIDKKPINLK